MCRLVAILLLLATSGMLSACGKGEPATHVVTSTTASHGSAAEAHSGSSLSKSQAIAFARAVNLQATDVPGFRPSSEHEHEHESASEKRLGRELGHCLSSTVPGATLGAPGSGNSAGASEDKSGKFERKAGLASQSVSSEVTVERTPAQATAILAAIRSARVRACISHYLRLLLQGQKLSGATIGSVSVKYGTPPASGTTGSFGLRFSLAISVHGLRIPFDLDILGFVDGPAVVLLDATGVPEPLPANLEERLFSLLLERAKTHTP